MTAILPPRPRLSAVEPLPVRRPLPGPAGQLGLCRRIVSSHFCPWGGTASGGESAAGPRKDGSHLPLTDGWLSAARPKACALALSEMCSCPNEGRRFSSRFCWTVATARVSPERSERTERCDVWPQFDFAHVAGSDMTFAVLNKRRVCVEIKLLDFAVTLESFSSVTAVAI